MDYIYRTVEFMQTESKELIDVVDNIVSEGWDIVSHSSYATIGGHVFHTIITRQLRE